MRSKVLIGNWKMNKTIAEARKFAKASTSFTAKAGQHKVILGVAPTFLVL
jgi:triosephosphate isomerase